MPKIFRKFRLDSFKKSGTFKYLTYAIGEILLVIIGILIALMVNRKYEAYKIGKEKISIITSMQNDWQGNEKKLKTVILKYDSIYTNMERMLVSVYSEQEELPLDTLEHLAGSFFRYFNYKPNLTTYNEAQSSGKFNLLDNKELSYLYTEYFEHLEDFDNHIRICSDMYYHGAIWEIRKETGFMSGYVDTEFYESLTGEKETYNTYLERLKLPLVSATFESQWNIIANIIKILNDVDVSTQKIIKKLDEMEKQY